MRPIIHTERRFRWLLSPNKRIAMASAMKPWIKRIRERTFSLGEPPTIEELKKYPRPTSCSEKRGRDSNGNDEQLTAFVVLDPDEAPQVPGANE